MKGRLQLLRYFMTIVFPLFVFIFITYKVLSKKTVNFDSLVYFIVSKFISPGLTEVFKFFTFLGSSEFYAVLAIIAIFALYKNEKYSFYTAMIAFNLLLSSIINEGLKNIFRRSRPEILKLVSAGGFSFPSGHSMVSMSFYGLLIFLCFRNFKSNIKYLFMLLLSAVIFLIGLSRIYLGVHYASDVAGGFSLGILWLGIYSLIIDLRYRKKHAASK